MIYIFIKYDDFTITDTMFCYYKKVKRDYVLNMENRHGNGLTIILSGKIKLLYYDAEYNLTEGDIILQRNGDSYTLKADNCEAEYIVTSYLCEPDNFINECFGDNRVFTPSHSRRYADLFGKMTDVYFNSSLITKPLLRAMTQEVLCNIIMDTNITGTGILKDFASKAKSYIDEYYNRFISGEDIAQASGCSESHLRKAFKNSFGETPNRYLNAIRIEKAKEMLSSGLFTVEEIALACGFRNVYYFNKVFKQYTGVTPGKY